MILAVKTTTSAAGLWVIVVVAVGCLALWLYMVEVFATRRGTPHRHAGTAPEPDSRQAEAAMGPPGERATPKAAVTRDDIPRVPRPRPDPDWAPGVPWTPPGQRQSPTDQPAPAEPRRDRRGDGPQAPG